MQVMELPIIISMYIQRTHLLLQVDKRAVILQKRRMLFRSNLKVRFFLSEISQQEEWLLPELKKAKEIQDMQGPVLIQKREQAVLMLPIIQQEIPIIPIVCLHLVSIYYLPRQPVRQESWLMPRQCTPGLRETRFFQGFQ